MCGCEQRQAALNNYRPGLGDKVATVAQPIKEFLMQIKLSAVLTILGYALVLVGGYQEKQEREQADKLQEAP
jgi:hypothetical protein